jgi:hypothetical protein
MSVYAPEESRGLYFCSWVADTAVVAPTTTTTHRSRTAMNYAANVTVEELPNGDFLVTADGPDGRWFAAGDLTQAVGEATYASMIGEPPREGTACAAEGSYNNLVDEFGRARTVRGREFVIEYAVELRQLG